jgi:NTP pyrophosphatase (non-canonical NTP hydrolase)
MDRLMPDTVKDLRDIQAFQRWLDDLKGFHCDIYFSLVRLTEEVGEVAGVMKEIHRRARALEQDAGHDHALATAIREHQEVLGRELSDCIAFISKIANAADLDLQQAYVSKMTENVTRDYGFPVPVTQGNRE